MLIATDKPQFKEYLNTILSHEPDMKILGFVENNVSAIEQSLKLKPNVFLFDLDLEPPQAGFETIQTLTAKAPQIRSIVFSHSTSDESIIAAFEAGAVDYLIKNSSVTQTLASIRAAAQDQAAIRPEIAKLIRKEFRLLRSEKATLISTLNIVYKLTPTELELLKLFAEGKTKNQILALKHIEPSTFRTHMGNVRKKFKTGSFHDLAARLKHLGIFEMYFSEPH